MKFLKEIGGLALTAVASLILILLGIIYFMLTIWIIKIGAIWAGFTNVEGNMVILGACIVTAAAMIGSAIQK
ncbi:MAG: hypothetical protein ABIG93_02385 [archaeon]|nr:hypothetical protein [Nanoarchaeota archaeon]